MSFKGKNQHGFTLIEVAIVLAIVGMLLGMILKPLGASYEQTKRRQTLQKLRDISSAVIGFAQAHGRIPCPATLASAGKEPAVCIQQHGYVPNAILGVNGRFNKNGHLVDSWNNPIRYSVSLVDSATYGMQGIPDFVSTGEMQQVGISNLAADFVICSISGNTACPSAKIRANQVPVVIYSTGKDKSNNGRQAENLDTDVIFLQSEFSQQRGSEYDDILVWISENILFTHLIEAGVLP